MPSRPNAIGVGPPSPGSATNTSLSVGERAAGPARARDGERRAVVAERLRVAQIQRLVLRELRMQRDVHVAVHGARQARRARGERRRAAGDGIRVELAVAHHAQLAVALRDQHRAVGQERQRERKRQRFREHRDADVLAFAGRVVERPVGERLVGKPCGATGMPMRNGTSRCAKRERRAATAWRARTNAATRARAMDMNGDPQVGSRSIGRLVAASQAVRGCAPREIWIPPLQPPAASSL